MQPFANHQPLSDAELDRLSEFLGRCKGGNAMNIEELDGFFAALVVGPKRVLPSEYYSHVFGGSTEDTCEFETLGAANATLALLMRHWNTIAATLYADEVYLPVLLEDDKGVALATTGHAGSCAASRCGINTGLS